MRNASFLRTTARRVLITLLMYVIMIMVFSSVFNGIADRNLRSLLDEEVARQMRTVSNLSGDDYQNLLEQTRRDKARRHHLDEPLVARIFWHGLATLSFDYGRSTSIKSASGGHEVSEILLEALPNTLALFGSEALLVTLLGGLFGLWAARRQGRVLDKTVSTLPMLLNGLPSWWVGMFMLMFFSYGIPLFPSGGLHGDPAAGLLPLMADYLWHLALPLLTLVLLNVWNMAWQVRTMVSGILSQDFIMAGRARGLPERRILLGHTLRTASPAIVTLAVLGLLQSLTGNILVEGIFNWPGLGSLYFVAVQQNDVPVLLAVLALQTLGNLLGFVFLDLVYGWLDPRIRVGVPR